MRRREIRWRREYREDNKKERLMREKGRRRD